MAYVPVPKDLSRIKSKLAFNLTKRQLICFSGGALVGVPLFFLLKKPLGSSSASLFMILVMLPFFMLALYEKNGQPMEREVHRIVYGKRRLASPPVGKKSRTAGKARPTATQQKTVPR